jgi:hypothetical protein
MPPLNPVPNVLKCQLLWSDSSDNDVRTTWFFRYSGGPPTATDCNNLAADIYSAVEAMVGNWTATTQFTGVEVTDLSSPSGGQGLHSQSTSGTRVGGDLAGGTAVVVGYVITRRYRGGKPRSYFPFFSSSDLVSRQQWSAGDLSILDGDLATCFAAIIGATSGSTTITDHVNVSYYTGNRVVTNPITGRARNVPQPRAVPVVDVITSFGARVQPGSQRRRNR